MPYLSAISIVCDEIGLSQDRRNEMVKRFLDVFCVVFLIVMTLSLVDWFVTLLAE